MAASVRSVGQLKLPGRIRKLSNRSEMRGDLATKKAVYHYTAKHWRQ